MLIWVSFQFRKHCTEEEQKKFALRYVLSQIRICIRDFMLAQHQT